MRLEGPSRGDHRRRDSRCQTYYSAVPGQLQPGDIANLALFLASDESRRINGAVIPADAGWLSAQERSRRGAVPGRPGRRRAANAPLPPVRGYDERRHDASRGRRPQAPTPREVDGAVAGCDRWWF
jgi:hypothetical protein